MTTTTGSDGLLAVLDLGTSEIKAGVVDLTGRIVSLARREIAASASAMNGAELPAEALLEWPVALLAQAIADSQASGEVVGVGVTGARGTVLAVDDLGAPLGPAVAWTDRRGAEQVVDFAETVGGGQAYQQLTGLPADPSLSLAAMLWWREHDDVRARARTFVGPQACAVQGLTGARWFCDSTTAGYVGLASLANPSTWDPTLLAAADVRAAQLPSIVPPASVVGQLSPSAAGAMGLSSATPVVAAASDAATFKVGIGVTEPGDFVVSLGTAASVGSVSTTPPPVYPGNLTCSAYLSPDRYDISGMHPVGGRALRWLRDLVGELAPASFDDLAQRAQSVAAGANGLTFVPWLSGAGAPRGDPRATGTLTGLHLGHGIDHLARAVFEGVCFAVREIKDALSQLVGEPRSVFLVGGAVSSPVWPRLLADVLHCPVDVPREQQPALVGTAMLTATAVGLAPDLGAAIGAMKGPCRRVDPRPADQAALDDAYERYQGAADASSHRNLHPTHEIVNR